MRNSGNSSERSISVEAIDHPGRFVRSTALTPKKLSVSAAAKLVGVGRPALSNFLNGNVAATPEMASRIEIAFGIPAKHLLDMQAAYEVALVKSKAAPANASPYVVPYLGIKATEIEEWVGRKIGPRARLSVLLRTLVNSTGNGIKQIDFPGNDDAERPGWDGYVDNSIPTPWVPDGLSGWEFGTNQDINAKADKDYAKSVKATSKPDQKQTVFVFVTPRHWPGKTKWLEEKREKKIWKDVRAYDSSDLEQWLEQSIAGQAWFANETQRPSRDIRTLDKCWSEWSEVSDPPLSGALFKQAIDSSKRTFISRLCNSPSEPTVIAADSVEEALAFLAQIFEPVGESDIENLRDRVLVFDKPGVLPQLAQGSKDFIAVATNRDVERELGPLSRQLHSIVIYPRNATSAEANVVLEPLNSEAFRQALEGMSYSRDEITKYSNSSGRSLTVLRRKLSNVPAIQTPEWAEKHDIARSLLPFMFIGAWNATNSADQAAAMQLANNALYDDLETVFQRLLQLNDTPIWSVGTYRGVVSKTDLLFAISLVITKADLDRYFKVAAQVLGEDDPKLDLPADQQWAPGIYGKTREFSPTLREGISETLVLLAVHGRYLFQNRLGFDCEIEVNRLVKSLLTPLKTRILEANSRDLSAYAEAAPHEFLQILEDDLHSANPESYGLLKPVDTGLFGGGSPRTGLLWALECLAWNPNTLPRTVLILAQLSGVEIQDNLMNKPMHSLHSIFRAWMPQTAASLEQRLSALELLANKFPPAAWQICIDQLHGGHQTGDYSHKPKWRTEAHGFGEPLKTNGQVFPFVRAVVEMLLAWKAPYSKEMLSDLIHRIHNLSKEHQSQVWSLVKSWAQAKTSDEDKAFLREKIRVTAMTKRGMRRSENSGNLGLPSEAKAAYSALEPASLLRKHDWLFRKTWVEESADELAEDDLDFEAREKRIEALRVSALSAILSEHGIAGIIALAEMGEASFQIGRLLPKHLLDKRAQLDLLATTLQASDFDESFAKKNLVCGVVHGVEDPTERVNLLVESKQLLPPAVFTSLLLLAPFRRGTWQLVDELADGLQARYWTEILPDWIREAEDETREAVNRLLKWQRPRAAFACVKFKFDTVGPEILVRLLTEMAKGGSDKPGQYQLDQHYIEKAFKLIDKSPLVLLEQKAGLEFAYIDLVSPAWERRKESSIPNLEKYVEGHPELFVQAIVWAFRRDDDGEDPQEWKVPPERTEEFATRGYKLLQALGRMPGHDELGVLQVDKLASWVKSVRETCAKLGRLDIADECIGKLLSKAPIGLDGIWPCEVVRQVMEDVHSKNMMNGAHVGLYNSRGATWRGEGGAQERALAEKYRPWANALQYSHPFLSSQLLMEMVKTYHHEATQEDIEAAIRKRLH
jgi:addiction module HigA family antidote